MSTSDNVFLDTAVEDVAGWLPAVLGAERVTDAELAAQGRYLFRSAATTVDADLALMLSPNHHGDVDPDPDDLSAMDGYPADLKVRLVATKDDGVQRRECQAVFDRLLVARPDVPMLLVTNLDTLLAAYLPAAGTHYFEEHISPDPEDLETWRPWVRGFA
jgi:hypothetical protein